MVADFFNRVKRNWENKKNYDNIRKSILISFKTDEEYLKHGKSYTKMLDAYVISTKVNIVLKIILKVLFFIITLGALGMAFDFFYKALLFSFESIRKFEVAEDVKLETVLSLATVMVPAAASLVVALMEIPKVIAEYLFNKEEENYTNAIIKNIQDYDTAMFKLNNELKELLKDNKKKSSTTKDESIDEEPEDLGDDSTTSAI